jgi:predicted PurR-regulated permease PerM
MSRPDRNSVFWWLYVAVLAGAAAFIAHSFVGIFVLGLFGYYATRPIAEGFERITGSKRLAAPLSVLAVLLPVLLLSLYAGIRVFQQVRRLVDDNVVSMLAARIFGEDAVESLEEFSLESLLRNPPSLEQGGDVSFGQLLEQTLGVLDAVFGLLILLALAVTLSYALLEYDEVISEGFARLVGAETTVYSYAAAVDADLESIFFGNLLFVLVMSVIATTTYALTNLLAPSGLRVPMVFTLGVLTGITSLIPIVVGKVIYIPIVGFLAATAAQQGGGQYAFVGGVLVVYFLVLDILPQSFIQPYISGREFNMIVLLFAYILGPILFGWYGFFLLPIVFVLLLEMIRIVLPELLHGEPIDPDSKLEAEPEGDTEETPVDVTETDDTSGDDGADTAGG